jgi:tetratricopeptide (TPR) repeat protein
MHAYLDEAAKHYREALAVDKGLVEARVRLGRVNGLLGRHEEAIKELAEAWRQSGAEPLVRYFNVLFLGEEHEALGHRAEARAAYDAALELYPSAQSAHLAISRLAYKGGDTPGALSMMRATLTPRREGAMTIDDPWIYYPFAGVSRHSAELLDALRRPFRDGGNQ